MKSSEIRQEDQEFNAEKKQERPPAFPDNRRFCSVCGAVLIDEWEIAILMMPKMEIERA